VRALDGGDWVRFAKRAILVVETVGCRGRLRRLFLGFQLGHGVAEGATFVTAKAIKFGLDFGVVEKFRAEFRFHAVNPARGPGGLGSGGVSPWFGAELTGWG
jgi:hypothetical protein